MELSEVRGTIFDIQHYSIHDGPGIRVNVFLKGCPLRCLWCQNPESQSPKPQLMYYEHKCVGCGRCIEACPFSCISRNGEKVKTLNCRACGKCVGVCPVGARELSGYSITAGEAIREVLKDKLFMGDDGGLTVTGGEPLIQPAFTRALLTLAKEGGIGAAMESSGFASWEVAKSVYELVDYALFDVKHMIPEEHKKCTGVSNEQILENLRRINDELSCAIHVRTPLVPGYNDSEENMHRMGRFLSEKVGRCHRVSLLPYHAMGESKKEQLCADTIPFRVTPPTAEHMEELRNILRAYGLNAD